MFCRHNLIQNVFSDDEYKLCESLLSNLIPWFKAPDLVINVISDSETIIERISKRGREFENSINQAFIEQQRELYNQFAEYIQREFCIPIYEFSNGINNTNASIRKLIHSILTK